MNSQSFPKIVYAGDREISAKVLKFLLDQGCRPSALIIPSKERQGSRTKEVLSLCKYLDDSLIFRGDEFKREPGISLLRKLNPDYIICIHLPVIITKDVLNIARRGVVNLHPAYLPYNKGYHTSTWAIMDGTSHGATLHFMDEDIDTGDIIHQEQIKISPCDTADTLSKKVTGLEYEVFKKAWPSLVSGKYNRKPQPRRLGLSHKKNDISEIQEIDINKDVKASDLIKQLKALSTNRDEEAACFKDNGKLYRIQVRIF